VTPSVWPARPAHIEDRVRKFSKKTSPEVLVHDGKHLWVLGDIGIDSFKFRAEAFGQGWRDTVVLRCRFSDVGASFTRHNNFKRHFLPNNSALISRHGRAEDGSS